MAAATRSACPAGATHLGQAGAPPPSLTRRYYLLARSLHPGTDRPSAGHGGQRLTSSTPETSPHARPVPRRHRHHLHRLRRALPWPAATRSTSSTAATGRSRPAFRRTPPTSPTRRRRSRPSAPGSPGTRWSTSSAFGPADVERDLRLFRGRTGQLRLHQLGQRLPAAGDPLPGHRVDAPRQPVLGATRAEQDRLRGAAPGRLPRRGLPGRRSSGRRSPTATPRSRSPSTAGRGATRWSTGCAAGCR